MRVLEGVRVVEVAQYVFVPLTGSVLAEWGAETIKVEPPGTGDAYRGLRRTGALAIAGPGGSPVASVATRAPQA